MAKKKKLKYPELYCSCGHLESDHKSDNPWNGWCSKCAFDKDDRPCICIEFRFDALLYLEELDRLYYKGTNNGN